MNKGIQKDLIKEIFLIISSFLVGGIVMLALIQFTPLVNTILGSKNNLIVTKNETEVYEKSSLAASVKKIYDAVVVVQGYRNGSMENSGTGFIYKVDNKYGYLLTNEHVISDSDRISILLETEEEIDAELLGKDEYLDLAVLRIDKKKVTLVASIGSSEKMNLGDTVFTVGSPLGANYRGSVTSGVLSGKDRKVSINVSSTSNNDWIMRVLQIDASINPGNSGGPLLNVNGEVIGICSLKLVDDDIEGMGFAIPIEYAMNHVDSLENGKKIKWPVLGINMINASDTSGLIKHNIKISTKITEGVVVTEVKDGSSASNSSLKKGDIIIKIDDVKVKDIAYLRYELYQHQAGDQIEVTYIRNDKEKTTKITLKE